MKKNNLQKLALLLGIWCLCFGSAPRMLGEDFGMVCPANHPDLPPNTYVVELGESIPLATTFYNNTHSDLTIVIRMVIRCSVCSTTELSPYFSNNQEILRVFLRSGRSETVFGPLL